MRGWSPLPSPPPPPPPGVLHVVSTVLRCRLLALWPVLVQLVFKCNPIYKFHKAC
jgi:hypothetical protein